MIEQDDVFLRKARESLAGSESEFVNDRYNNSANRAYYAVFQAAIHALLEASVRPPGVAAQWGHDFVQARFIGDLINRRKRFPAELRTILEQTYRLRVAADYERDSVSEVRAARARCGGLRSSSPRCRRAEDGDEERRTRDQRR